MGKGTQDTPRTQSTQNTYSLDTPPVCRSQSGCKRTELGVCGWGARESRLPFTPPHTTANPRHPFPTLTRSRRHTKPPPPPTTTTRRMTAVSNKTIGVDVQTVYTLGTLIPLQHRRGDRCAFKKCWLNNGPGDAALPLAPQLPCIYMCFRPTTHTCTLQQQHSATAAAQNSITSAQLHPHSFQQQPHHPNPSLAAAC